MWLCAYMRNASCSLQLHACTVAAAVMWLPEDRATQEEPRTVAFVRCVDCQPVLCMHGSSERPSTASASAVSTKKCLGPVQGLGMLVQASCVLAMWQLTAAWRRRLLAICCDTAEAPGRLREAQMRSRWPLPHAGFAAPLGKPLDNCSLPSDSKQQLDQLVEPRSHAKRMAANGAASVDLTVQLHTAMREMRPVTWAPACHLLWR